MIRATTRETLNKLIPLMVRQAHHERNQQLAVRPEPVEGLVQRFPSAKNPVIPAKAGIQRLAAALLAVFLLLAAAPTSAETLGKLFLTPERRAALERQRQLNIQETRQVIEGATLTVSGVVKRSSGKTTTWVNDTPQNETNATTGVRVEVDRANPAKTTVVAGEESPASLKVGEAINRATRETTSGVGDGHITVKRQGAGTK